MAEHNRGKKFPTDPPTREEMALLFAACGSTPRGKRDQVLLMMMYRLGFRCAEACSVRWPQDVRRRNGGWTIRTVHPKGWDPKPDKTGKVRRPAKPRELALDPKAQFLLETWLAVRGDATGPLLVTETGRAVETSHARRLLKTLCRRAGIDRRINPHSLRHAFASELVDEGNDVRRVQNLLGHNYLMTTITYVDHLQPRLGEVTSGRTW